jgi:REP element-mobilizing transposase RayT
MSSVPHGSALRKGRFSFPGQIYAITTVTRGRVPVFAEFRHARKLVGVLREQETFQRATTLCFVIMPDHLHWLMQLGDRDHLSHVVRRVKAISSRRIGLSVWQKSFHERAIRKDEDVVPIARYIVANPLRAGLVERIGDYPHWDAAWL